MKWIKGYEGLYKVSEKGEVFSYHFSEPREVKQQNHRMGYKQLHLCKKGRCVNRLVHRLVAEAFLPNPQRFPFINHLDFDTSNNNVKNLEWCNAKMNVMHNVVNEKHGASKLSGKNVILIKRMLRAGVPEQAIANFFKVTQPNINSIKKGKTWAHIKDV